MKRILFVTDQTFEERGYGGAEITIKELGKRVKLPVDVEYLSLSEYKKAGGHGDWIPRVLTVFSNIALWDQADINALALEAPYIKMEFDYGFCKTHLKNCDDGCKSCVEDGWYKTFLEGAERIFFTCPMQKDAYRRILGSVADNSILNPSWIDPDLWSDFSDTVRDPHMAMYHGRLFPHKGVLEIAKMAVDNPDVKFVIVGAGPPEIERRMSLVRNVHLLGEVDYSTLLALLNRTTTWVMPSQWDDTGPMAAIEAYLCGAKLAHNGRLGYLSYPWDWENQDSVRDELRRIPERFWGEIASVLDSL